MSGGRTLTGLDNSLSMHVFCLVPTTSVNNEAEALYQLAAIAYQRGRTEYAFALASEAVELSEPNEISLTLAWSLHLIGVVDYQASNYPGVLGSLSRGLAHLSGNRSRHRRGPNPPLDRGDLPVDGRLQPSHQHLRERPGSQRTVEPA